MRRCLLEQGNVPARWLRNARGSFDRRSHLRLGSEMGDARESMLLKTAAHQVGVTDVAPDEGYVVRRRSAPRGLGIGRVGHGVDYDQAVVGPREGATHARDLADEPAPP